jgi:uncharacterized protein (DUF58 family)
VCVTTRGYGVLVAGVVLFGAGHRFGYPELAVLGCAAVIAVAVALCFVAWRPRLEVVRTVDPDRVMRGEPSQVRLRIGNASRIFGASLIARDRCVTAAGSSAVPVPLLRLRRGRVSEVGYPVPTARRGLVRVGPLEVTRRDPLGLVGVVRRYGWAATVWVRPRVHPIAALPVGLCRSLDGQVDRVAHGTITFAALRPYVAGDDLRRVHWRTSARVGELMVRENVDTSLPRIVVLLDDRAAAHAPDGRGESTFESACEAAASVLVAATRAGVPVELQLVGGLDPTGDPATTGEASSTGGAGPAGRDIGPLLDRLAQATLSGAADLPEPDRLHAAAQRLRVRRVGDTLLYLGGLADPDDLGVIARLRGVYPSIIAGIFGGDADAHAGPSGGLLVVGAADGADFAAAWDGVRAW